MLTLVSDRIQIHFSEAQQYRDRLGNDESRFMLVVKINQNS